MAVGVTSSIMSPYKGDHTIDAAATVKHGEAVFTHGSPRSLAPGADRGTPVAIGSAGPGFSDRVVGARPQPTAGYMYRTYLCPAVPFC